MTDTTETWDEAGGELATEPEPPRSTGFVTRPGRPGHCVVCDVELTGPRAGVSWYCPEHKGQARGRHPTVRKTPGRTGAAERLTAAPKSSAAKSRVAAAGKVSDAAATNTLSKLLIVLCVILVHYRLRGALIADPTGEIAETLAPTNAQAKDMTAPLARWGNSTVMGARVIAPIVRNEDIVLAVYAWWEWNRNVSRYFEQNRRGHIAPVQPIRPDGTGDPGLTRAADQVIMPDAPLAPPEVRFDPTAAPPAGQMEW